MLLNQQEPEFTFSKKFEKFRILAVFAIEGPHMVMSKTDAQNGLELRFKKWNI